MMNDQQLLLPVNAPAADYFWLRAAANAAASQLLDHGWPGVAALVVGAPKSGKSTLLRCWAEPRGALYLKAQELAGRRPDCDVALDDLDEGIGQKAAEEDIFHLYNHLQMAGKKLFCASQQPLAALAVSLPDLQSRLAGALAVTICDPDIGLVKSLLSYGFNRRQHAVEPAVLDYCAARLPRDYRLLDDFVAQLDALSLRLQRPVTVPLARHLLEMVYPFANPPGELD